MPKKANYKKSCTIAKPSKTRKAPAEHAKCYTIGTEMVGIDGAMYVIRKPGKGAARWYPVVPKPRAPKMPAEPKGRKCKASTKARGALVDTEVIQKGERGGRFVIRNGRKVYLKKGQRKPPAQCSAEGAIAVGGGYVVKPVAPKKGGLSASFLEKISKPAELQGFAMPERVMKLSDNVPAFVPPAPSAPRAPRSFRVVRPPPPQVQLNEPVETGTIVRVRAPDKKKQVVVVEEAAPSRGGGWQLLRGTPEEASAPAERVGWRDWFTGNY